MGTIGRPYIAKRFRGKMVPLQTMDGTTLYVHAGMLDSAPGMSPEVPWDTFRTSTVERYLEYCYQGNYRAPKPAKVPSDTPTSSADGCYEHDHRFWDAESDNESTGVRIAQGQYASRHNSESWDISSNTEDEDKEGDDTENDDTEVDDTEGDDKADTPSLRYPNGLDYGRVFLAHAELYILSKTQKKKSLASLCFARLCKAIKKASEEPVRPRFAKNLSDLLLYVYKHGGVSLVDDCEVCDLQSIVRWRVAEHIEEMKEECSSIMWCGGKLAEDLMKEVVDRVVTLESWSKHAARWDNY
ncbi:hypothetical protein L873DRAFT_1810540 [Choiromyces venosus 120613-1]|uniref:BTB domain-containing protein n=1 Tax=Choiromyces venosus 120613-1 TaxID=1336337 RepID=A0A3N4JFH8_9PEZI|nr:hypothetical protein L873DRAFT_1810540 [Choiromyces venosus 120613-1]